MCLLDGFAVGSMNPEREDTQKVSIASGYEPDDSPLVLTETDDAPEPLLNEWPEDGVFYRATRYAMPGFSLGYLVAHRAGVRVAVIPYFITAFRLNTMLDEGWAKRVLGGLSLRVACVGHPTVSFGRIEGQVSSQLLNQVSAVLGRKAPIVAFKGFGPDLPVRGFVRVKGLPVAMLNLEGDFWSTLHNHKQRNDFTRKLRASSALRFEEHDGLPAEYLERIHHLYLDTRSHAALRFERLSPEYFSATAERSIYVLAFLHERLVGFAQMLSKGERVVGKYLGMDYAANREHGVYFALCLHALEVCSRRGYKEIELGETGYSFKQALGCSMVDTWHYYRHRNPIVHALLARLAFLLEPSGKDLPG